MHGVSFVRVFHVYALKIARDSAAVSLVFFFGYAIYCAVIEHYDFTFIYVKFYVALSLIVSLFILCVYALTFAVIRVRHIVGFLKNNTFSFDVYISFIAFQSLIFFVFPLVVHMVTQYYDAYDTMEKEVEKISFLLNKHTFYGTNAQVFDSLTNDQKERREFYEFVHRFG